MTEQRCGTCRYYIQHWKDDYGLCRWAAHNNMPEWAGAQYDRAMSSDGGKTCRVWQAKDTTAP